MPTTPINGLRYPAASDAPNGPAQVGNLAADVDSRLVGRFATAAARDAAITAPADGMIVWLTTPGVFSERVSGVWRDRAGIVPHIAGTLTRSDGVNTVNGPNAYTGLKTVPVGTAKGTWTTYTDPNGVGHACTLPGIYVVSAMVLTDIASARCEQIELLGTSAEVLGIGGASGDPGATYGGAGGSMQVRAPSGINVAFRYIQTSTTVAGTIRGSRYSITWLGPA